MIKNSYIMWLCVLCASSDLSAMMIKISGEYINMTKRIDGVSDGFIEAILPHDTETKLLNLTKHYQLVQKKASEKSVEFMDLDRDIASDSKQRREQIEIDLKSLRLEEYRAQNEMLALLLSTKLTSPTSPLEHMVGIAISVLQGNINLVDVIEDLKR